MLEKAVKATPHSPELWLYYIKHVQESEGSNLDAVRACVPSCQRAVRGLRAHAPDAGSSNGQQKLLDLTSRYAWWCARVSMSHVTRTYTHESGRFALTAVAQSEEIWNKYLEFETKHDQYNRVSQLYYRILG